jgi:hypothetical protein
MQGADGDGCRCGAVSVGGGGVDHDLGVQRVYSSASAGRASQRERGGVAGQGCADSRCGRSTAAPRRPGGGGRSVVRPYIALEIIAVKVRGLGFACLPSAAGAAGW